MLSVTQKRLHRHTKVSQLNDIAWLMALKSQYNLSQVAFDNILTVFGSLLSEGHILRKSMYEAQKFLQRRACHTTPCKTPPPQPEKSNHCGRSSSLPIQSTTMPLSSAAAGDTTHRKVTMLRPTDNMLSHVTCYLLSFDAWFCCSCISSRMVHGSPNPDSIYMSKTLSKKTIASNVYCILKSI